LILDCPASQLFFGITLDSFTLPWRRLNTQIPWGSRRGQKPERRKEKKKKNQKGEKEGSRKDDKIERGGKEEGFTMASFRKGLNRPFVLWVHNYGSKSTDTG